MRVDSDERHWDVDMREVDAAVLSYWRMRVGWQDTPTPVKKRRWSYRSALPHPAAAGRPA